MSSFPARDFSPWGRRRTFSLSSSQGTQDRDDGSGTGTGTGTGTGAAASFSALGRSISAQSPGRGNARQQQQQQQQLSSSLSSSQAYREPIRSFIHGSVREHLAPVDSIRSVRSVRQDTAELASYILSDKNESSSGGQGGPSSFVSRAQSSSPRPLVSGEGSISISSSSSNNNNNEADTSVPHLVLPPPTVLSSPATILEVSEPPSPAPSPATAIARQVREREKEGEAPAAAVGSSHHLSLLPEDGPSILATMLRRSSPASNRTRQKDDQVLEESVVLDDDDDHSDDDHMDDEARGPHVLVHDGDNDDAVEEMEAGETSLLLHREGSRPDSEPEDRRAYGATAANGVGASRPRDLEGQKTPRSGSRWLRAWSESAGRARAHIQSLVKTASDPRHWDRKALWQNVVVAPAACLPAVIVGLLLNILDALSYGMILFPLGSPIFAGLGSAGISIFYVSTIIAQLTFSFGSIFRGGVGSELIEVVPFFHSMAVTITALVGEDQPDAVIATTITSYALSSMLTGAVFYLMGQFKFGYIVGFIPRHILIGCIGGVGWFLVATGFEVTARMGGSLEYDLDTLRRLGQPDTVPLWSIPLALAVVLFYGQTRIASKYFLPLYIISIPLLFYFFVVVLDALDPDTLRQQGWIFEGPPAGEPWWYFYTLYKFDQIHLAAIVQCVPAMFALTFFGILHVPINVPALALNTGEDHADLDHELKLHGYSNFLSGAAGSIQNYLVYANTLFFMRSGGDSRLAGILLAACTGGVAVVGPALIGFIPVMMVGVLIFDLGFELLLEAVWQPRRKLKRLEYLTVLAIVLIMGVYDFVVGIGVGILLAFVSLIFQTSRVSAVRSSYSGEVVSSTVRRNLSQQHYLRRAGRQLHIMKLCGYLFFGTIGGVEDRIRALVSDAAFAERPIKFLVLDFWQVTGLDYSAGEAFNTISRLLHRRGVELVLSGVDPDSAIGRDLRAVGVGEQQGIDVVLLTDLNSALERCENELLRTFYASQEASHRYHQAAATVPPPLAPPPLSSANLDVPPGRSSGGNTTAITTTTSPRKETPLPPPAEPTSSTQMILGTSPRNTHLREVARTTISTAELARLSRWQSFKEPLRLMLQIFHHQDLSPRNEDFWFRAARFFARAEEPAGTVLFRRGDPARAFYLLERGIIRAEYDLPQGRLCESIVAGTTCGELPFFSDTRRTATAIAERDLVVWLLDRERWELLQAEEPEVARELLRVSLKLTSERMSAITGYVMTMAG